MFAIEIKFFIKSSISGSCNDHHDLENYTEIAVIFTYLLISYDSVGSWVSYEILPHGEYF